MIHSLSLPFSFLLLSCSLSHSLSRCPILVSVTHTPALSHTICLFLSLTHSKMDSVWKNDFTCVLSGEKPSLRFFYAVRYHQPEMFTACQKIFSHQVLRFISPPLPPKLDLSNCDSLSNFLHFTKSSDNAPDCVANRLKLRRYYRGKAKASMACRSVCNECWCWTKKANDSTNSSVQYSYL